MENFSQWMCGLLRPFCKKSAIALLSFFIARGLLFALPEQRLSQSWRLCLSPHADAQGRLWIRDGLRVRHYRLWAKKSVWNPSLPPGKSAQGNPKNTSDFFLPLAPLHPAASVPMLVPTEEFLFGKTLKTPEFRIFRTRKPADALHLRSSYWFYAEKAGRPLSRDSRLFFLHPELQASDLFPELLLHGCLLREGALGQSQGQGLFLQARCPGAFPDIRLVYADGDSICPKKALRYDARGFLARVLYFSWKSSSVAGSASEKPLQKSRESTKTRNGRLYLRTLRLYFGSHPLELQLEWF